MSESQCCHWWTKKQSAEEASRATYALVMPPPIPAEAHSPIRSNNNNNNSVLTPVWDELKVIFLLQNVICMVRYVILPYFVQFSFTGVTIALPFFFWQHKAIPFLVSYSITVSRVLKFIDDFSHIFVEIFFPFYIFVTHVSSLPLFLRILQYIFKVFCL